MTRYLTAAGAPLDNNCIEQGLKKAILAQLGAFFTRLRQARLMSVMNTAFEAEANPIEYLVALIENKMELVG